MGYHAVTLREVYESWRGRSRLPPRPIVPDVRRRLSQRPYECAADLAFTPVAVRVLNLAVRNNGGVGGLSTWKIHQLLAAGWELDSHSLTHPDLTQLASRGARGAGARDPDACCSGGFEREWTSSATRRAGTTTPSSRAVKAAGYLGATTTRHGLARAHEAYVLARIRVNAGESGVDLGEKLHDPRRVGPPPPLAH